MEKSARGELAIDLVQYATSDKISTSLVESGLVETRIAREHHCLFSGKPRARVKFPLLFMSVGPLCILFR